MHIQDAAKRYRQTRIPVINPFPRFDWGGAFEGWARGFVKRNLWRVAHRLGGPEDALQECAIVFIRCKKLYEGKVLEPKHFMALFKIAVQREFHTLSERDSSAREAEAAQADFDLHQRNDLDFSGGMLAALLSEAPKEVAALMLAILSAPGELLEIVFKPDLALSDNGKAIEVDNFTKINRRAKRLFGISGTGARDLFAELRELLTPEPEKSLCE